MFDTSYIQHFPGVPIRVHLSTRNFTADSPAVDPGFLHVQDSPEILMPVKGRLHAIVNDKETVLDPGDVFICSPFDKHSCEAWASESPTAYYYLIFELPFFQKCFPPEPAERIRSLHNGSLRFIPHLPVGNPIGDPIREALPILHKLSLTGNPYDVCRMVQLVMGILTGLLENGLSASLEQSCRDFHFIRQCIDYVDTNFSHPISMETAAEALSYSKSHFCHRFKECFGVPFGTYLNRFRIEWAAEQFSTKRSLTLSDAAAGAGFTDYAYFSRTFRRYTGKSPLAYRRSLMSGEDMTE